MNEYTPVTPPAKPPWCVGYFVWSRKPYYWGHSNIIIDGCVHSAHAVQEPLRGLPLAIQVPSVLVSEAKY